jgi:hypothetical protein
MGKFSPTRLKGDCEEIANPSTAYGRRRRNWIDTHGSVPDGQVVDASCGNDRCIALRHAYLRPRVEQPGKVPEDCRPSPQDESRSGLRCSRCGHGRAEPQPIPIWVVRGCAAGQGLSARAAGRERARDEDRGMVERASLKARGEGSHAKQVAIQRRKYRLNKN